MHYWHLLQMKLYKVRYTADTVIHSFIFHTYFSGARSLSQTNNYACSHSLLGSIYKHWIHMHVFWTMGSWCTWTDCLFFLLQRWARCAVHKNLTTQKHWRWCYAIIECCLKVSKSQEGPTTDFTTMRTKCHIHYTNSFTPLQSGSLTTLTFLTAE